MKGINQYFEENQHLNDFKERKKGIIEVIMNIESYYFEFLNHNLSRDFLSVGSYAKDLKSKTSTDATMQNIVNEKDKFQSNLYYSISIEKDGQRYSDRLFFDFDLDNETYKDLKSSSDARDMLFNSNIMEIPFNEVSMVYDYLKSDGFKPYVNFSGSKGFHLYCFFNPCLIENIALISLRYAETLKSELNLKSIDFSVHKDAHMRKARLPYSRHKNTDLYTTPCDVDADIKDILSDAVNPSIRDFQMSDYIVKGFSDDLIATDKEVTRMLEIKHQRMAKEMELKRQAQKDIICHNDVDLSSINMRHLVGNIASEHRVKSMQNYDIYNCPFHNDNHHSAGCYEKRFYCSACGKSWNYYEFVAEYFDLEDKNDIINEVKKYA